MTATLAPPTRQALRVDWQAFADLRALGLTVTVVEPADLGGCTVCAPDPIPLPAQAVVVYRTSGGVVYREPVDVDCARHLVGVLHRTRLVVVGAELPAVAA